MIILFFPESPVDGDGDQISLPHQFLEWIRNQVHRVSGDDPKTESLEGTLNLLAQALLRNDRALLDYMYYLEGTLYSLQSILNAIGPGSNYFHVDNNVGGHQDISLGVSMHHSDVLEYGDTWILGSHSDQRYSGSHLDQTSHQDHTVIHSDAHGDHTDHYDASHGDRAASHSDHHDHANVSHGDTHGDSTQYGSSGHGDHSDNVHYDQTVNHTDWHTDHGDVQASQHGDVFHLDYWDSVHGDTPHGDVDHEDYTHHLDITDLIEGESYLDHANYTDHGNISHHDVPENYYYDTRHQDRPHTDSPHADHVDHWDSHGDQPGSHSDSWHHDHLDWHTDSPGGHTDTHSDTFHQDYGDHVDSTISHIDSSHLDTRLHSDNHSDIPGSHQDQTQHFDHGDLGAEATHQDGYVHQDRYY